MNKPAFPLALEAIETMASGGCTVPGCKEHADMYYLQPKCHQGAGLDVAYKRGSGVLSLSCHKCSVLVAEVSVALIPANYTC